MVSLLDGQIAKAIYAGFKGKLLIGTLSRGIPGNVLDPHGDPTTITPASFPCQGFVEAFSVFFKAQAGIPDNVVSVTIFAQSITTVPTIDDVVIFRGTRYQLRRLIDIDPAVATYRFAGFQI